MVVLLLVLVAGGAWFYRGQQQHAREGIESELSAVAELKAHQIAEWRAERVDEGAELTERPLLAARIRQWLEAPSAGGLEQLQAELEIVQRHEEYADVVVVDVAGRTRFSLNGTTETHERVEEALAEAFQGGRPVLTDLHVGPDGSAPHVSVVAPVFDAEEDPGRPLGAVILVSDAREFLYPLVQWWPTPSGTAETLLVRRDGDDVLFLNELRHRQDTALKLRIPLRETDVPAVKAVVGVEGFVQGEDYRGVDVVAVLRPIPGSPWFMVAKVDTREAFAEWRSRSALMVALLLGVAVLGGAVLLIAWQRDQKVHFRRLYQAETARAAGEALYGVTLASIGDGVITTDAEGLVDMLNPVAEQLTGWRGEDARGRPLHEVFHIVDEETRAEVENPVVRVLREGVVVGLANHTVLIHREGTERPIADSGAPIRTEQGDILGVVLVFRDQTEERAAQGELLLLTDTIRASMEEIYLFDAETLCFRFVNDGAVGNLGYSYEELAGLTPLDLKPEFARETFLELVEPLRNGQKAPQVFETVHRRKDGTLYPVEVHLQLLDHSGERVFLAAVRDITERRQAEEQLRRSEADLKKAQEVAHVGSWKWHIRSNRLEWSDEMYRVFGIEKEGFTGDLSDVVARAIHPDDRAAVKRSNLAVIQDVDPRPLEYRVVWPDGTERVVYAEAGEPILDDKGYPAVLIGITQDVTERRQAEAERRDLQAQLMHAQKMESVGRLAGGVAHDFNNMLSVILGHTELALARADPASPLRADLEEIRKAAQTSADLTRQLLAFARRQTVAPRVLDLNQAGSALLKMLQRLIGEDIDLAWVPGEDLWPVEIDPSQVDQILANLCVNARDAIDGVGAVTIETENVEFDEAYCALHADFLPGSYVMLGVSDDGRGMGQDVMDHLFEPFFTTDTTGRNTGLGLATVYGIVKQNDGFINVYSEIGAGSTFKVYLPRSRREVVGTEAVRRGPERAGRGETVLLVEDEPAILNLGTRMLEGLGYSVLAAGTPGEALRLAEEWPGEIHLLITDVVMPEMNGRALADRLRAVVPGVRCLFMSGYTANVIAHRGVLDQGVSFLEKPFSRDELAAKVREALEG